MTQTSLPRASGRTRRATWKNPWLIAVAIVVVLALIAIPLALRLSSKPPSPTLVGTDSQVIAAALSPDGRTLATGDGTGSTRLWDLATRQITATLTEPGGGAAGLDTVAFSPDGSTLAVGNSNNGHIYLWNVATRTVNATLTTPGNRGVNDVAFSSHGNILAADGNVSTYLWNVATRKITATLTGTVGALGLSTVGFSPNGRMLATACTNGSTDLWDVTTGTRNLTLTDPDVFGANFVDASFSPDGNTLATVDGDGYVYLWNTRTGRLNTTLSATSLTGNQIVAFSPDGGTVASTDLAGDVYLWDVADGTLSSTLSTPGLPILLRVMFTPAGNLVAVCASGQIYLWHVKGTQ